MAKRLERRGPAESAAAVARRAETASRPAEARSGGRFVHNGVLIDMPDLDKRKAALVFDEETVEVRGPDGMDLDTFRGYCEQQVDEFRNLMADLDKANKARKAAQRIYDEHVASADAVRRDQFDSSGLYTAVLQSKTAAVHEAAERLRYAENEWKLRVALLADLKRRLGSDI